MLAKGMYATALLFGAIASQVCAIYLMPMTRGATLWLPTAAVMVCFAVFTVLVSRLLLAGFQLSLLVPILAAAVPLGGILVGFFGYGETASFGKIVALLIACSLVGVASLL